MVIDADVPVCCGVSAPVLMLRSAASGGPLVEGRTCSSEGEAHLALGMELRGKSTSRKGTWVEAMVEVEVGVGVHRNSCRRRIYYLGPFKFLVSSGRFAWSVGLRAKRGVRQLEEDLANHRALLRQNKARPNKGPVRGVTWGTEPLTRPAAR
jgi:hypothetical protein